MVEPTVWSVFLANFAMGRNTVPENLTDYDMQNAYVCWNFIKQRRLFN